MFFRLYSIFIVSNKCSKPAFLINFNFMHPIHFNCFFLSDAKLKCIFWFHLSPRCPYAQHPTVDHYLCGLKSSHPMWKDCAAFMANIEKCISHTTSSCSSLLRTKFSCYLILFRFWKGFFPLFKCTFGICHQLFIILLIISALSWGEMIKATKTQ